VSEGVVAGLFRGPPAYAPQTPWRAGWALLAALLIVAVGIFAAAVLSGTVASSRALWRQDLSALATLGIWQAMTIVLTVLASALFGGRVLDVLGLRPPAGRPAIYVKALLLMVLLQATVSAVQFSFMRQDMYADLRPFVQLFGEQWLLALLVVGVGAPLSEELLFRGFLMSALARSRLGFTGAALLTTGLWTALHAGYSLAGIVEVFLIGLYFSWLLWRTGSLRVAIFCHALYNSFIIVVLKHVPLPG
jgi:membrane protease YdiL (CAAX protease family)